MSKTDEQALAAALKTLRDRVLADYGFAFDPSHALSTGYWTHDCGAMFYGGGRAIHNTGCTTADGYRGCTYHFGPEEVEDAKRWAADCGGDEGYPMPLGPLTLSILREKFPELL